MAEVLTIDEIESRFPDEWILLIDPVSDQQFNVLSGEVVAHSKEREDIDRIALALMPASSAVWFNGDPEMVEILTQFFWD